MTRETLEVDVLIVGGGPAGLASAVRLAQLQKQHGGPSLSIAVLEKAREAGAHEISGAVLDPSTLRELIPDFRDRAHRLPLRLRENMSTSSRGTGSCRFRSCRRPFAITATMSSL